MLVVLYAVIREKENGVPCMGCFPCAFAFGSYFHVWSSYKKPKNPYNLKKPKNLKKTFSKNLGFFKPGYSYYSIQLQTYKLYTELQITCC